MPPDGFYYLVFFDALTDSEMGRHDDRALS